MKTIATELREFFILTGCTQKRLAQEAKIFPSVLCRILKGKQHNLHGSSQDRLRLAMIRIAGEHGIVLSLGPIGAVHVQETSPDN